MSHDLAVTEQPVVYLAGPDVFLADAAEVGRRKIALCAEHGLDARFPLDAPLPELADTSEAVRGEAQARTVFDACLAAMDSCDAVLANLTPFRGVSADVGTAFEIGYLFALGRPVFAYTSEPLHYQHRAPDDGCMVEPYGLAENLMVACAAHRAGNEVVRVAPSGSGHPLAAFEAFEACVRVVATALHDHS